MFVGCASAHRHAAFDGCRYIMDFLKTDAPFWKSEETHEGRIWVSEREKDQNASKSFLRHFGLFRVQIPKSCLRVFPLTSKKEHRFLKNP